MSRPKPTRLLTKPWGDDIQTLEIADIPQQYAVVYQGQLFALVKKHLIHNPKYLRTMFQTKKPAENLAAKLNRLFVTNEFTVVSISVENSMPTDFDPNKLQPRYHMNAPKEARKGEILDHGHVRYQDKNGVENIRLNSRKFPTTNLVKTLSKNS